MRSFPDVQDRAETLVFRSRFRQFVFPLSKTTLFGTYA
jgi:hypothetical protein